jgi:hypothetical protein
MKDSQGNNCRVLGTSRDEADYITTSTPMQLKKKEIMNDPQYQAEAMDTKREAAVTAARQKGPIRPSGGHGA